MKYKKMLTTLILVISSIFFCVGCANVNYYRGIDSRGVIVDRLEIDLDESSLNKAQVDMLYVKELIINDMIIFRNNVETWKDEFTAEKYGEFALEVENGIICNYESDSTSSRIDFWIEFSNWKMFGIFYGLVDIVDNDYLSAMDDVGPFSDVILNQEYTKEEFGLFFYKCCWRADNVLDKVQSADNYIFNYEYYNNKYSNATNNSYTIDDIELSQLFIHPDDRLYSDNCDSITYEGDLKICRWNYSVDEDKQMEVYKLLPRPVNWYILGMIISAIVVVVAFVVICIKKQTKKRNIDIKNEEDNGK